MYIEIAGYRELDQRVFQTGTFGDNILRTRRDLI